MATRSRSWLLTQKAENLSQDDILLALGDYTFIAQLEEGSDKDENGVGYKHYQIYIENEQPIRFDTLKKKLPTAHIETRKGSKSQAYAYCTKDETRLSEPFGNGIIEIDDAQGKRTDITQLRDMIFSGMLPSDIILEYPSAARHIKYLDRLFLEHSSQLYSKKHRLDLEVTYITGAPGTGKTRYIYDTYGFDEVYRVTDYDHPFDQYEGQDILVLDEFHGQLPITLMLNVLDIYPLMLPARYNNKWAGFTKVYIITNLTFEEQYPNIQVEKNSTFLALKRRIKNFINF